MSALHADMVCVTLLESIYNDQMTILMLSHTLELVEIKYILMTKNVFKIDEKEKKRKHSKKQKIQESRIRL